MTWLSEVEFGGGGGGNGEGGGDGGADGGGDDDDAIDELTAAVARLKVRRGVQGTGVCGFRRRTRDNYAIAAPS